MIRTENGIYDIDPDDTYISNHMNDGRIYEHHIINGALKPFILRSKYVVDVGANIGCHTVSYALFNPACKIWAFEPQDKLFRILLKNIEQNNVSQQVEAYKCCIGHKETTTELQSIETAEVEGGYNKGGIGIGYGGEPATILTLDSFELPGLDYMKIDVEGAESLVIMGARETIRKYKPVICFEHNDKRISPEDVGIRYVPSPFEELVKLGYKHFSYIDWENYIAYP